MPYRPKTSGERSAKLQYQQLRSNADAPAPNAWNEPDIVSQATYKTAWTEWGAIESISGREFLFAQEINAQTTHRVYVQYRAGRRASDNRSTRDRFLYFDPVSGVSRYFNIEAIVTKDESRPIEQICLCTEQVV